jgi:alcohol oxidase
VETGPHTRDEPNHIQPARCYRCRLRPTETFTFHVAKPSPALHNRSVVVATGRALGGGSSVNCMKFIFMIDAQAEIVYWNQDVYYTRAAASDYDDWENVYGNKGWGSEHLIPLLKKVVLLQST